MNEGRFKSFTDTELIALRYWYFSFQGVSTTKLLLDTSDNVFDELIAEIKKRGLV